MCPPPELNSASFAFIKNEEGFAKLPYKDVDKWAIGYGHQCSQNMCQEMSIPSGGITEAQASAMFVEDLMVSNAS